MNNRVVYEKKKWPPFFADTEGYKRYLWHQEKRRPHEKVNHSCDSFYLKFRIITKKMWYNRDYKIRVAWTEWVQILNSDNSFFISTALMWPSSVQALYFLGLLRGCCTSDDDITVQDRDQLGHEKPCAATQKKNVVKNIILSQSSLFKTSFSIWSPLP